MLTDRQRQIAEMLSREMSYKAIGRELGISPRTVKAHIHSAAKRINPASSAPHITLAIWFVRVHESDAA